VGDGKREIAVERCATDWGMMVWYAFRKPIYLWQFVNVTLAEFFRKSGS
jgi:hypothetical protein